MLPMVEKEDAIGRPCVISCAQHAWTWKCHVRLMLANAPLDLPSLTLSNRRPVTRVKPSRQ